MSDSNSSWSKAQKAAQDRARAIVDWAKRRGSIPPPSDFSCEDCGRPATVYDHRDYNKPLDVAPVCQACNVKRGPGKPVDGSLPIRYATGYIVGKEGVQPICFQCVDFEDECEPRLSELPSYPEELSRQGVIETPAQPASPQLWSTWR